MRSLYYVTAIDSIPNHLGTSTVVCCSCEHQKEINAVKKHWNSFDGFSRINVTGEKPSKTHNRHVVYLKFKEMNLLRI